MEWLHYVPDRTPARARTMITVVPYEARFRDAFRRLNEEWLTEYMEIEPEDRRVLGDPEGTILARGGAIIFALDDGTPIGCGALINEGHGKFELAKLAVTRAYRGRGLGQQLSERLIAIAKASGARQVELLSQTALPAAVPLYRKLGFREVPLGDQPYARANIRMVRDLVA